MVLDDGRRIDLSELTLIGIHIGVPWTDEMISMAWKHENVFIGVDAYAPKHWPRQLVHYLDSYGRDKVLFGTDWPVIDPERAVAEIAEIGLRPQSHAKLMRENALAVFRLPESGAGAGASTTTSAPKWWTWPIWACRSTGSG